MTDSLKTYYRLTKPGIIYGNLITTIAGFLLASQKHIFFLHLLQTLAGLGLVIASACVFNNYLDRDIDRRMARTKARALVAGAISSLNALIYAAILGLAGFAVLALYTNWLTVVLAFVGFSDYVVLYGIFKRRSIYGTLVGSIAGSMPIVVGYTAAANRFDSAAVILFLILTLWQMPHFYAIALYRRQDYKEAKLPVLPVLKSAHITKLNILLYTLAFTVAVAMLTAFGYTGYIYLAGGLFVSLAWVRLALLGFKTEDNARWARKMFFYSLLVTLSLSVLISVGGRLP